MKSKSILFVVLTLVGLLGWQGCKKEVPIVEDPTFEIKPPNIMSPLLFPNQSGRLAFIDENHFEQGIANLILRTPAELLAFGDSIGLLTQGNILRMVESAEDSSELSFYAGLASNLSPLEYDSIRPGYQHSLTYRTFENAGLVETILDSSGRRSIQLTMKDRLLKEVLNDQGEVMIGNRLHVYENNLHQVFDLSGNLLEQDTIGKREGLQTNHHRHWHLAGSNLPSTTDVWILDPCLGPYFRYSGIIVYGGKNLETRLNPQFYFSIKAEACMYGRWQKETFYTPFRELEANWKYYWSYRFNGVDYTQLAPPNYLPGVAQKSPHFLSLAGANEFKRFLNPTGTVFAPPGLTFLGNPTIYAISFRFRFNGCPGLVEYEVR